jgi:hypothetical protein
MGCPFSLAQILNSSAAEFHAFPPKREKFLQDVKYAVDVF